MFEDENLQHWRNGYPIENFIKDLENGKRLFQVINHNRVIGTVSVSDSSPFFEDNKKYIYISKLAVHPDIQGQGVGKFVLQSLEAMFNKEYIGIRLDVYEKSTSSIAFYSKLGFNKCFYKKTKNFFVICMERKFK